MKLYMVRHGETEGNARGISQGQGVNYGLNEKGKQQAEKIAERLRDENIEIIYASDLKRARETAETIMKFHQGVALVLEKALREKHHGDMEGKPHEENRKRLEGTDFVTFKTGDGESMGEAYNRITDFFHRLYKEHKNKKVVIVSHGAILKLLLLFLFKKPLTREAYDSYKKGNVSLTIIDIKEDHNHHLHILNCTKHLEH